jgi:ubiquinone/menaquinone biosynthesis C-methylase UbiE
MNLMPNIAFRMMSLLFKIADLFRSVDRRIDGFGIKEGYSVVDYGCGPARYIKRASELVGERGRVYAADIHRLAVQSVEKKIRKYNLKNVEPVLINEYSCGIGDNSADLIYALDMFHMVKEPEPFLRELHRIIKNDGFLIIEHGHQPRAGSKRKMESSNLWNIVEENEHHMRCTPIKNET